MPLAGALQEKLTSGLASLSCRLREVVLPGTPRAQQLTWCSVQQQPARWTKYEHGCASNATSGRHSRGPLLQHLGHACVGHRRRCRPRGCHEGHALVAGGAICRGHGVQRIGWCERGRASGLAFRVCAIHYLWSVAERDSCVTRLASPGMPASPSYMLAATTQLPRQHRW